MATFLIHKANDETQVIKLKKDYVTLGRRNDNDIVLDDVFVSREHAEVIKKGKKYILKDRKSRYGTFVNGDRIIEVTLNYGDEIQLGNTIITFVDEKKLDQIPERKTPTKKIGARINLLDKIEEIKLRLNKGEKKELILSSLNELKAGFALYQTRLAEAEKSKEIASTLCEVGNIINFVFDLNVLLNLLMDLALKILQARRGFIMLYNEESGSLKVKVARNMGGELAGEGAKGISQTIAWQAFKSGKPITTEDATKDKRFMAQESVISYAIGSVICVPLISKDRGNIGVMYLDNPVTQKQFHAGDIQFMTSFANQAAIAIENAQLYEKIKEEEKIRARLQRFFSPAVVKKIMSEEGAVALGGENRTATILFCDIRGYTSLVEKIDTLIAVEILNDFLSSMTEEVFLQEGTLDKYIGDCVMAIFGAPVSHPDDPLRAIKAALGMKERVHQLKETWRKKLKIPEVESFEIGIGIHTGEVIAGNVGNINRMEYTVVSTAVNLASRLENAAGRGQILISHATYEPTKEFINAKKLSPVKLKNISRPVQVYEVLGLK
ncbi:MAG TPA: FHA domain-containing protein [candidate division WOR-3 bacterium]|uniref:FHA domain-containing protein n=1 Tax=candidate division WOR-3 bacterium TaxID=2052148 RepID=A0A9C9EKK0_UNCW3|nr:FHA domain-containing protein [candidate division WOR-3 bacterium]